MTLAHQLDVSRPVSYTHLDVYKRQDQECSHVIQTKQEYETLLDQRDRARREKEEAERAAAREISRVKPVSYTHLDVYKRQGIRHLKLMRMRPRQNSERCLEKKL